MRSSWRREARSWVTTRRSRRALLVPAVVGVMLIGVLPAAAAPTPPTPSVRSTGTPPSDVDAARAAEAAAAQKVAALQARYDEASAALSAVQAQVSEASTAYATAVADLERVTTTADAARAQATLTAKAADLADRRVRDDAASAYMQGAGPMNQWAIYLSADGLQEFMDLHADLEAIGSVHQGHLVDATLSASAAATDRSAAESAQAQQTGATTKVEAELVAVQQEAVDAGEAASRIQTQQQEMLVELAAARKSTLEAEQARLEELASAAKAAGGAFGGGRGTLPLVSSGGSAELTAAQLDPRSVARAMLDPSLDASQWGCLDRLWFAESGWRWSASNPSSGAYGIPQSLPGSKMASAGADWLVNPSTQIAWGLGYIESRYGTPCAAWQAFLSRSPHWY
ncbi:MAG: hypothetical protein ABI249_03690 [Ornithinibacter sp.]